VLGDEGPLTITTYHVAWLPFRKKGYIITTKLSSTPAKNT